MGEDNVSYVWGGRAQYLEESRGRQARVAHEEFPVMGTPLVESKIKDPARDLCDSAASFENGRRWGGGGQKGLPVV